MEEGWVSPQDSLVGRSLRQALALTPDLSIRQTFLRPAVRGNHTA